MRSGWAVTLLGVVLVGLVAPSMVRAQKPPDALESMDAEWSGIQTDLLEVKRMSDNTVRVRWRWRNTTDKAVHLLSTSDAAKALKEGAYLIDAKNKKKHFSVTDAQGKVIGTALGFTDLAPKQTIAVWAKFPAPPADVGQITVVVPRTPPFEDVALK
jgi:hypothetical protein